MPKGFSNSRLRKSQRTEHIARINCVIDFIEDNLDQNLSLAQIARVATFSRFHFHRIFGAIMGETLYHYISRLRLEKAASQLIETLKKALRPLHLIAGSPALPHLPEPLKKNLR